MPSSHQLIQNTNCASEDGTSDPSFPHCLPCNAVSTISSFHGSGLIWQIALRLITLSPCRCHNQQRPPLASIGSCPSRYEPSTPVQGLGRTSRNRNIFATASKTQPTPKPHDKFGKCTPPWSWSWSGGTNTRLEHYSEQPILCTASVLISSISRWSHERRITNGLSVRS